MHTESLPSAPAPSTEAELAVLLAEHAERELEADRYERMCELLERHIGFGRPIPGLACPDCGRPIVFTWNWGASACLYLYGGCGRKIGRPVDRSRMKLPWDSISRKSPAYSRAFHFQSPSSTPAGAGRGSSATR